LQALNEIGSTFTIEDYLNVDDRLLTSEELTLDEIAQSCSSSNILDDALESDEEIVEESPPVSGKDARQGFLSLRQYCEENGLDPKLFPALDQIEHFLAKDKMSKMKQPTLFDLFTRK
jgi:hypothetical protein